MSDTINPNPGVIKFIIKANGNFPGSALPVILYKNVLRLPESDSALACRKVIAANNWTNNWTDSIFDYNHFHSNTHEVLCINFGSATVLLGGPDGRQEELTKGDIIILPAGVAHKKISASDDFSCVGGYPGGKDYDIQKGEEPVENLTATIAAVPLPDADPIFGRNGLLTELWGK